MLDFGLAKLATDASSRQPSPLGADADGRVRPRPDPTRQHGGTASYMARSRQGRPVDARTDCPLGTVLYEMATARRAFGGDDIPLIVMKIINGIVVPASTINGSIPAGLDAIIQKLMAVDPQQRYQTAGELLAEVQSASQLLEIEARRSNPAAAAIIAPLPPSSPRSRCGVALVCRAELRRLAGTAPPSSISTA